MAGQEQFQTNHCTVTQSIPQLPETRSCTAAAAGMLGSSQLLNDQKLQGKGIKSPQIINSVFTAAIPEMWVHCSECKSSAGPALTSSPEPWDTVTPVLNPQVFEGETCRPWSLLVAPVLLCPAVHSLLATRHHALCAFFKMTKHAQCSSQPPFSHGDSAAPLQSQEPKSSSQLWQTNSTQRAGTYSAAAGCSLHTSRACALPVLMLEVKTREDIS